MRIPTGNFGNVLPQAQPTRVDVGNVGAIGDAVAQLGRAGLGVAEDIQQRQEQDNQNALQALSTAGGAQVNKLLYDPETGMTATRKGINAVGATNDTLKEWDAWRDKQLSLLPPAARQRGGIILTAQRVQMERTSFVYEQGERERALQETYNASNNASVQRESLYYGDKISTQLEAGSRNQGIEEYGKAQGWPEEKIAFEKTLWQQKAASGAFDLFVSQQKQSMMGPGGALPTTGTPDLSQLASANMYVESRGQQFRADGSPLVSGAGAVGVAQVMEKTGPEAAQYAGVEWNRERWLNDPQYNLQIGNAYFEHLGSKYGNNPVLTVAAYNAGPGMVDDWINGTNKTGKNESLTKIGDPRKGEISDAGFTSAIPLKETREHVQKVLGAAASIPPGATIGSISRMPFWNKMSPQDQSSAIDKMSALYDMRASAGRVALQSKMQDDLALLEAGKNVSPITPEAWASTLPVQATPAERMQLEQTFRHYQQAMSLQPVYQSIVQGTPQQGLAAVQALQPQESAPDFKYQQELYATAQNKLTQVLKAREADPGAWLVQNDETTRKAFSAYSANPELLGDYVKSVIIQKQHFGIKSDAVLPKAQAEALSQALLQSTPENQSRLLDTIHKGTGSGAPYMATLKQIAVNAPSAAVAGVLMDKPSSLIAQENWINPDITISPSQASKTILAGSAARKGTKDAKGMTMPKENDMRLGFSSAVQNAFAGDAQGAAMAYEVAKDYYAGIMAQKGDYSGVLDDDVWKQAVNVSTGGVHDYNGMGYVLLPWGMSAEQFDKQVDQAWQTQVTGAGVKAPPGQYGLQSYGDSQYLVKLGAGYLLKSDGSPVILDLTQQRQRFIEGIPQ